MAQGLYDITPLEPLIREGHTLLTPNLRLARRIKAEWDARRTAAGERTWEPLAVLPLESWLLQKWEQAISLGLLAPVTPLNPAQNLELWRQVISEQERQAQDYHLLRPAGAAELASQARDTLQRWQVDMQDRNIRQSFNLERDCGTFLRWLALFERRLTAAGQCTQIDCLVQLPKLAGHLPAAAVALVEFEEVQPLLRAALGALCQDVREVNPGGLVGERLVHSFSDKRAELQAVATWAAGLHRANPTTTIGIVLGDMGGSRVALEYLLRREFDCLGAHYNSLPVNFSAGVALAQTPLVRDALGVLAMGLPQTTVGAVVELLRSRFLHLPDAHSASAQRFVISLYQEGREVVSLGDLRYAANKGSRGEEGGLVLGQYLHTLSRMRELQRARYPSQWIGCIREILSLWGWPGRQPLDSLEHQQLDLWNRTLDEFRAFDGVSEPIDFTGALQLLSDCCHRQISQPQTADSPVQVLGVLEAAGLAFEHLWVCGMQGTSWPESPRPNPFVPVSLQTLLQMPHATTEREWAFSEALLRQYTRSCQVLHASYCRQIDGVQDLPSALLQDFVEQPIPEPPAVSAQWSEVNMVRAVETLSDHQGPPVDTAKISGVKGGSGLIEDQSHCPFRAFARRRLLTEPLPAFNVALSSAQRGALLHHALYALWGEIRDFDALIALQGKQEEEAIVRSVQVAIDAVSPRRRYRLGASYWHLEGQRMATVLQEWLAVERQRSTFFVAEREQEFTLELAQLPIRLRVDRIDELPDGSRVIIDYKSGEGKITDWLGSRPAKPQLLLYAVAEPDTAAALAFGKIRARQCGYVGLGRVAAAPGISTDIPRAIQSSMDADDWMSLNECWRDNLERLAQDFVDGVAGVDPLSPSSCTWCGLQPLCRVDIAGETFEMEGQ